MNKLSLLLVFFIFTSLLAQEKTDSTLSALNLVNRTLNDSLSSIPDSLTIGDSLSNKPKKFDVDAIVYSKSSDSLIFDIKQKKMFVYGKGEIKYKKSKLNAGEIDVHFETNEMHAKGSIDPEDSTGIKIIDTPVLAENGEEYQGERLKYNFKTQQGFISLAKNEEETSRYEGEKVKKVDKNTYFIKDGIYTTCESDTPHTYFSTSQMKVVQGDKVFAKWIFLHIADIPLPVPIPWAVFPNKSGRRSGFIVPSYGATADRGQYFRNFGYFWAISDYLDLSTTADFYSKGGWGLRSRLRYSKRYDFNGNIEAGFSNITKGEDTDPNYSETNQYNLKVYHSQDFNPTTKLNVNLQFMSSDYLQDNGVSYNDLLRQNIVSNATFSKRWDSGWSMQLNYNRNQNLQNGDITESLPKVSFNKKLFYPFKSTNKKGAVGKEKWYEKIGVSYNGNAQNKRNKRSGELEEKYGAQHKIQISASPKIGYFNLSPSFSYDEKWYPSRTTYDVYQVNDQLNPGDEGYPIDGNGETYTVTRDSVAERRLGQWNFVRTFNFRIGTSTKLYGMARPQAFGIEAFRHTITPSISYNIAPDFSKDGWGYYDSYTANGETVFYDKFLDEIYGGVPSQESQSINFSLGNLFEMKTMKDPTDTTSQSDKIRLLNLSASTGYNFAADSLKLSDLSLSYRTQIGQWLNFNGSSSYTFYDTYISGNSVRKINTLLMDAGKGFVRMTNLNLSLSTTISGEKLKGENRPGSSAFDEDEFSEDNSYRERGQYLGIHDQQPVDFAIPWSLSLNYTYNLNKRNPDNPTTRQNLGLNLSFNLTKNWKFTFRGNYDIEKKVISAPAITAYRDLHCWEMNFSWYPLGSYRGFRFEIRLKAPELQDVKLEKADGLYSGR